MNRKSLGIAAALVAAAWLATLIVYPRLADQIPTHWNIHGEVDGYGAKSWAAFLMPAIMAGMFAMFVALPWLSPQQFAIERFQATYGYIVVVFLGLLAYIHALMLWTGVVGPADTTRALLLGMLLMFGLLGNVLGKVRRNFWVGVRTPWTIASERVWNDTHRLAGRLFVAAAGLGLLAILVPLPTAAVSVTVLALIMTAALVPVGYSLVHYKRLERRGEV